MWIPFGPNSRARLCAVARSPALAAAKAAKPAPPRRLAVAPVNRMAPRPRSSMWRAASRPVTNPAKQASCQTRWNRVPVVSNAAGTEGRPGVEQAGLERADIALDGFEQGDDSSLVAGVSAERLRSAAGGDDGIDVWRGFFQGATDQAHRVAALGEAAPYGRADRIAGADDRHDLAMFCRAHGLAPSGGRRSSTATTGRRAGDRRLRRQSCFCIRPSSACRRQAASV